VVDPLSGVYECNVEEKEYPETAASACPERNIKRTKIQKQSNQRFKINPHFSAKEKST
jgi:hypothetical protein